MDCPLELHWYSRITNNLKLINQFGKRRIELWLLLFCSFGLMLFSHQKIFFLMHQQNVDTDSRIFIPNVTSARMFSLGFDQLLADCYWLAFISYIGDSKQRRLDKYKLADEYLSLIVELDPYLVNAYWYAAFIVGSEQRNPRRAADIIDFGIRVNQDNWYLPFIAGINQYLYAGNDLLAARYYRKASTYPEAPRWLKRQAEIFEAKIPSTIKKIHTWNNIYYSETDLRVKELARQKLIDLWGGIIVSKPPLNVRVKATAALEDLGVDVDLYVEHFKKNSK